MTTTLRIAMLALSTCLALAAAFTAPGQAADQGSGSGKYWAFIGTQAGKQGGKGIYRAEFDTATGQLTNVELAAETKQPTFLAIHPNRRFLYSVNEVADFGEKKTGAISAFGLDAKTGKLTPLNQQSSGGTGPCYVAVDREGKCVLAANYTGGSVCCLPIRQDGSLSEASAFHQDVGKSVVPNRQDDPHAHWINTDPNNRFALATDLGLDKVFVYRFDPAKGSLDPNDPSAVELAKGAGPRHLAFHPNGKIVYVVNELDSTVTAMNYDAAKGVLKPFQSVTTLPTPFKGNSTAAIVVHPSAKFLYASNRGHNSIAIFTINDKTGELTAAGHQDKDIKTPRNFVLDPTAKWLIVENQDSGSIVVFRVDQKTGQLNPTTMRLEVPRPVCMRFVAKV